MAEIVRGPGHTATTPPCLVAHLVDLCREQTREIAREHGVQLEGAVSEEPEAEREDEQEVEEVHAEDLDCGTCGGSGGGEGYWRCQTCGGSGRAVADEDDDPDLDYRIDCERDERFEREREERNASDEGSAS